MESFELNDFYSQVRSKTLEIIEPLSPEDCVVQPAEHVSPSKWHLGHTTWFFETFILKEYEKPYQEHRGGYDFIFNSYYESHGQRVKRNHRGLLTRPSLDEVIDYRKDVDQRMQRLLQQNPNDQKLAFLTELGLNHEQQHQELMYMDIKAVLSTNPIDSVYSQKPAWTDPQIAENSWVKVPGGQYDVGHADQSFCYDNEEPRHTVTLTDFEIQKELITNAEYLEFMADGGYQNFGHWHEEGWHWVRSQDVTSPDYWRKAGSGWETFTMQGWQPLDLQAPVCHVSHYEAFAFANWKGCRLPTEFEWEVASDQINWGSRWEHTASPYTPYPGFQKADGAIGEYNGKFMINQMVLRGACGATPAGHSRKTYRNFFHPMMTWIFSGIRLAKTS